MAYAVCVTWIAKDGEEEAVAAAIGRLLEPSRAEPGVHVYVPHRDPNDPRVFFVYEQYADEGRVPGPRGHRALQARRAGRRHPAPLGTQA